MKSQLYICLFAITFTLLLVCCGGSSSQAKKDSVSTKTAKPVKKAKKLYQESDTLTFSVVGDIMFHDFQIQSAHNEAKNTYNFEPSFRHVKPIFKQSDVVLGNLETTMAGPPYSGFPSFCCPDTVAYTLKKAGFNFLVTANNHCLDKGNKSVIRTNQILDRNGIPHTGTFANEEIKKKTHPYIWRYKGFKIAIVNHTYGTNDRPIIAPVKVNLIDTLQMARDLKAAKDSMPDVILMAIHWGDEYMLQPNSKQKAVAKFAFEHGVDMILGAHPHVLQPLQKYDFVYEGKKKTGWVIYSLGNFISNMRGEATRWRYSEGGIIFNFRMVRDKESKQIKFEQFRYIPVWVWVENEKQPNANVQLLPCAKYEKNSFGLKFTEYDTRHIKRFLADTRQHLTNKELGFIEQIIP